MTAFNPDTGKILWAWGKPDTEILATPAFGDFNRDHKLDVALSYALTNTATTQGMLVWIDGQDGKFLHQTALGMVANTSPLTADFNGDGLDEVIVAANIAQGQSNEGTAEITIFDGKTRTPALTIPIAGAVFTTPVMTDIDGNHKLDLIVVADGLVQRYELTHSRKAVPKWSQSHGPEANGTYKAP
jgi:hypothetical protein